MKIPALLCLLLLSFGCQAEKKADAGSFNSGLYETPAYREQNMSWENFVLPYGFEMDSSEGVIGELNCSFIRRVPLSGRKLVDDLVRERLNEEFEAFVGRLEESRLEDGYKGEDTIASFYVYPDYLFINPSKNLISFRFYKQWSSGEMPAPDEEYVTINIDLRNMQLLEFDDVFRINSTRDYEDWLILLNSYMKRTSGVDRVYNYDFNFAENGVFICFDAREVGSHLHKVFIPKSHVQTFMKEAYLSL